MTENVFIDHAVKFDVRVFDKYMKRDLKARIKSMDDTYAYSPEELILAFFNTVLTTGVAEDYPHMPDNMQWHSVRIPNDKQ